MTAAADTHRLAERVAAIERQLETERPHLATKADLVAVVAPLETQIASLKRDIRWGLLLLTLIAAGEWLPQIRSLF